MYVYVKNIYIYAYFLYPSVYRRRVFTIQISIAASGSSPVLHVDNGQRSGLVLIILLVKKWRIPGKAHGSHGYYNLPTYP